MSLQNILNKSENATFLSLVKMAENCFLFVFIFSKTNVFLPLALYLVFKFMRTNRKPSIMSKRHMHVNKIRARIYVFTFVQYIIMGSVQSARNVLVDMNGNSFVIFNISVLSMEGGLYHIILWFV